MTATVPRTSIIMPVYNTAHTVTNAIQSVLHQTDPNFELLILIDGSPDNSSQTIKDFLHTNPDPRIRLFDNPHNQGVSAVRNQGLDHAQGTWIAFLDSDDYLAPNFLETLRQNAEKQQAHIAMGTHYLVNSEGKKTKRARVKAGRYSREQATQMLLEDSLTPYIWDKLFARQAVKDLRFPLDIRRAEDAVFLLHALNNAQRLVAVDDAVYNYRVLDGGLTWGRVTPVAESKRLLEYMRQGAEQVLSGTNLRQAMAVQKVLTFLNNAQQALVSSAPQTEEVISECRREFSWSDLLKTAPKQPVFAAAGGLLKISPHLYKKLYGAYVKRTYGV